MRVPVDEEYFISMAEEEEEEEEEEKPGPAPAPGKKPPQKRRKFETALPSRKKKLKNGDFKIKNGGDPKAFKEALRDSTYSFENVDKNVKAIRDILTKNVLTLAAHQNRQLVYIWNTLTPALMRMYAMDQSTISFDCCQCPVHCLNWNIPRMPRIETDGEENLRRLLATPGEMFREQVDIWVPDAVEILEKYKPASEILRKLQGENGNPQNPPKS